MSFSSVKRLIGHIDVQEEGELVYVEGINTFWLMNAFHYVWGTSKIGNNIFTHLDRSSFSFNRFFVPDMFYVLNTIRSQRVPGSVPRSLDRLIELLKTETWFRSVTEPIRNILNRDQLKNMTFQPLKHQEEFFDHYESNIQRYHLHGFLLAAAPGAGKTYSGLAIGEMLDTDVNIFIVPKNSIDLVWKQSFETLYKDKVPYWVSSSTTSPAPNCKNYAFHYESLDDAISFVKHNKFKNPMLWLDESHNLNEMDSVRSQKYLQLKDLLKSKHNIWASGTPIKAMGREVIPLLRSTDPYFNQDAEERFTAIFGKASSRALDILNHRMGLVMHRTEKSAFVKGSPISKEIKVKIPDGEKYTLARVREVIKQFVVEKTAFYEKNMSQYVKIYEDALLYHTRSLHTTDQKYKFSEYRNYIADIRKGYDPRKHKEAVLYCNKYEIKQILPTLPFEMRDAFKDAKTVVKYLELKVIGMALGQVLGKLREQCVVDMVRHADLPKYIDESEKKTLIFSSYVNAVKEAYNYLEEEGYKPLVVYGDTNKDLNNIISKFTKDEDANPLIATFASLFAAVPLVMANTCVMLNVPFRDYIYTQAIGRVDRIGQDTQVYLIDLYLDTGEIPNLSTRAGEILEWAREQVAQIVGKTVELTNDDEVSLECFSEILPPIEPTGMMYRWG